MLGEVGLDRIFRGPIDYFAQQRELTPFVIPLAHQLVVLEAQLDLAVELGRNVSVHSVKSQLNTMELLDRMAKKHGDRWIAISVDMHRPVMFYP
jgi:Tat protein secretion system quality control protein TatD with DNase activity